MSDQDKNPNSSKPRILVGICSCRKYPAKRQAVRETWADVTVPGVEFRFFVGGSIPLLDEPDTVVLDARDTYEALPEKVLAFFAHALERFDFDWLFKCDDDTYVVMERLHAIITSGVDLIGDQTLTERGAPSGGAGYLLSRAMVERLVQASPGLPKDGAEDLIITKAAISHGARAAATKLLHWNYSRVPRRNNNLVTCHWIKPDRMRILHSMLNRKPDREFEVVHSHWRDRLQFFNAGYFARASTPCCGIWSENEGKLSLKWLDWGEEVVTSRGSGYANEKMTLVPYPGSDATGRDKPVPAAEPLPACQEISRIDTKLDDIYTFALIISLPESNRLAHTLPGLSAICHDIRISPGIRPDPNNILWREIRGMEAYNRVAFFRGPYIPNALGCRLAGLHALRTGSDEMARHESCRGFLVFQDDAMIEDNPRFHEALRSLPDDADCLWLDTHQLTGKREPVPDTPLQRISGARLCTGFWISKSYVPGLVERLAASDCEWDIFMEREMKNYRYYAPIESLCRQRHGVSEITGAKKW